MILCTVWLYERFISPMKSPTMLCLTVLLLAFCLQDVSAQSTNTDTSSGLSTCKASKADLLDTLDTVLNDNDAGREQMKSMAAKCQRKENNLNLELQVAKTENEQLKQSCNTGPGQSPDETTQPEEADSQTKIAFWALLDKVAELVDRETIVVYGDTKLNARKGYDNNTGVFECPYSGLYTFFWTNIRQVTLLKTSLIHNEKPVVASSEAYDRGSWSQTGNSALLNLALRDRVYIALKGNCQIPPLTRTSFFIGHLVAEIFGAFYAVLMGNLRKANIDQTVTFDTIKMNNGNFYDSQTGTYSAPRNGVYRFFWSATSRSYHAGCHTVLSLNNGAVADAKANASDHFSMAENSVLLDLNQGDRINVKLVAGGQIGNDATGPGISTTSFFAHMVSGTGTTASQVIAFCAVRTTSMQDLGYITYDKILANAGNAFNPYSGGFEAPLKGTYKFYLNAHSAGITIFSVGIQKNSKKAIYATQRIGSISQSTSIILELEKGDTIYSYLYNGEISIDQIGENTFTFSTFYGYLIFSSD